MKVKVAYTTVITEIIEVDDKFSVLSIEDPRFLHLDYAEERNLMAELIRVGAGLVGCYIYDINKICDADTDEILAEV